jgi:FKBP-type peptidyl-prolyl cis-trans isomerase
MLQRMSEGDQLTVIVPSSLAYGEKGNMEMNIPPYSPMVFDLELLRILPQQ